MNAITEGDTFDNDIEVIIGATSQTGRRQLKYIDRKARNVLRTGSSQSLFTGGGGEILLPGLPLKDEKTIRTAFYGDENSSNALDGIRGQVGDYLTFGGEIDVTLHAMNMVGMSEEYPEQVVKALENTNGNVRSVLLISYEAGFDEVYNPKGSHVFYPVRKKKTDMEESALRACEEAKIVDLLTFDSKSAKALGLTFLGVVGDFVNFLESDYPSEIQTYLKGYLGESYNGIIEMFQELPIRGELQEGQKSMKALAEEGKLNGYINSFAKKNNFALFSRISGEITALYLKAAMKYMNDHRAKILGDSSQRVLLDWSTISQVDGFEDMKQECLDAIKDNESSYESRVNDIDNARFFTELGTAKFEDISYTLNPKHIDTIGEHFGIIPLILLEDLVLQSGLLQKGERIKVSNPTSMIFAGNDISLKRSEDRRGNPIIVAFNPENSAEVFGEFTLTEIDDKDLDIEKTFFIPDEDKAIDATSFPHSMNWGESHLSSVQTQIAGELISPTASIKEHIGFRLANLLLNNPREDIIELLKSTIFPKTFSKFDSSSHKIAGRFGKIDTLYEDSKTLANLPDGVKPEIYINKLAYRSGDAMDMVTLEVDVAFDGTLLGKYKFIIN